MTLSILAVYALSRALLWRFAGSETDTLAASVIFRVSALHGLILALVFAQEQQQYGELRLALTEEASAVSDLWNDMARFGGPAQARTQAGVAAYAREVAGPEWAQLGRGEGLSGAAWSAWDRVYEEVLSLAPTGPRETALQAHMLDNVHRIARLRDQREAASLYRLTPIFWVAAVVGIVLIVVPYFTFAPTVLHVSLLGIYGAYVGLVMHLIWAFTNPFEPPARLAPVAFERLIATFPPPG